MATFIRGGFVALFLLTGMVPPALAAEADILGRWTTHKGGQIEIAPCDDGSRQICGFIARLAHDDHDTPPLDTQNPEPALRDRPLLGLKLFFDFDYDGDDRWKGGRIYNVENGKTYKSKLRLLSQDQLKLSGCVFIFCSSYTWNRTPPAQEETIDQ